MRGRSCEKGMLLRLLDEAYDHPAWHGPNLRSALRGVSAQLALWRPAPGRPNIWELALHCAYWKYAVWRKLSGAPRGSFPRRPANFPAVPPRPDAAALRADLALLDVQHRRLREAIASLPTARLRGRFGRSSPLRLISGVAAHDVYHAGQIRTLVRLSETGRAATRRRGRQPFPEPV